MPEDDSIKTRPNGHNLSDQNNEQTAGPSLWRKVKAFILRREAEPSLREQIEEAITEHEESDSVDDTEASGDLLPVERTMLRNLLEFSDHNVDDVMVPRSEIIAVEENSSFEHCVALFSEHGHSRLPVYRENLDNIIGMIHIKDFFALITDEQEMQKQKQGSDMLPDGLEPFLRQPRFVPESMGVLDLLAEMRATRTHLTIVLDEYSGTEGLVTIEDLVEEIVGEIEDEHDEDRTDDFIKISDTLWEAQARAELENVAEQIDPRLAEIDEDVHTLGGLAFALAGKVPAIGEIIHHPSGWRLEVMEGDDKRVVKLHLHAPPPQENIH